MEGQGIKGHAQRFASPAPRRCCTTLLICSLIFSGVYPAGPLHGLPSRQLRVGVTTAVGTNGCTSRSLCSNAANDPLTSALHASHSLPPTRMVTIPPRCLQEMGSGWAGSGWWDPAWWDPAWWDRAWWDPARGDPARVGASGRWGIGVTISVTAAGGSGSMRRARDPAVRGIGYRPMVVPCSLAIMPPATPKLSTLQPLSSASSCA